MANYKTHATVNLTITLPLCLIAASFLLHIPYPLILTFAAVFAYGTLFMHPDLDLAYQVKATSLRGILGLPFITYSRLFRHRGLSHSFLFGTITRVVWLGLHVALIMYVVYKIQVTDKVFIKFVMRYQWYLMAGFLGLFVADCSHLTLDRIWDLRRGK